MGGLGKTTLAKNLYHSPSLTDIFDARAWVCVSQQYNTMHLLKDIIKSIQGCDKETLDFIAISDIISLRYNDLPIVLKHCFLYFGIFPIDRQIDAENLMWLWMADGLIPRGEKRMEDVAQDFLNELIRRSLVQVVDTFWEEVVRCWIHDLLPDLAIQKALEVNFFDIYGPRKHSRSSSCRRHTINGQGERMETLMRHLPVSGQEGIQELKKIAARFEEKTNTAATSSQDYLQKIAIKMLTMETKSQNPNAHGPEAASYETISGPEESDEEENDGDVSKEDGLEEVVVMEEQ